MNFKQKTAVLVFLITAIFTGKQSVQAQQDPMYTQYMENLQVINPGFAGSAEKASFMVVARNQWVSFEGAPQTRTFSFYAPLSNDKVGIGFSLMSDKIGPLNQTGVYFDYSYFLKMGFNYKLGMGIKSGFSFYRSALTDLETVTPDPIYSRDIYRNFLPNFGVGAFLFSDDTYVGFSVPKLIQNRINRHKYSSEYVSREEVHFYMVAGKELKLNEDVSMKSHSMLKLVKDAPVSFDLTAMLGIKEGFWFGGMYRMSNAWGMLVQFYPVREILIGYSYDITFSGLNAFNNGTHEIMLSYNFNLFSAAY